MKENSLLTYKSYEIKGRKFNSQKKRITERIKQKLMKNIYCYKFKYTYQYSYVRNKDII